MIPKFNFLVNLNNAWIEVNGKIQGTTGDLEWRDRYGHEGLAHPGTFMPYYPRALSEKEINAGKPKETVAA